MDSRDNVSLTQKYQDNLVGLYCGQCESRSVHASLTPAVCLRLKVDTHQGLSGSLVLERRRQSVRISANGPLIVATTCFLLETPASALYVNKTQKASGRNYKWPICTDPKLVDMIDCAREGKLH